MDDTMEFDSTMCTPPCSMDTYDYLLERLFSEGIACSPPELTNLSAEFNEPEDNCSITLQKVQLPVGWQPEMSVAESSTQPALEEKQCLPLLPSNTDYPGAYKFSVEFEKVTAPLTKSTAWAYSEKLNKLFVRRNAPCPIRFKTAGPPPPGSYVRALLIYSKIEDIKEVVERCPAHFTKNAEGYKEPKHILHCNSAALIYETCPKTGRLSVKFPCEEPQAGTDYFTEMFKFGCFSSCSGGPNRRHTQIIFTLENDNKTIGRRRVDVRICACPGRDLKSAEGINTKRCIKATICKAEDSGDETDEAPVSDNEAEAKPVTTKTPQVPPMKRTGSGSTTFTVDIKKVSVTGASQEDNELFLLVVRGREDFAFLSKLKQSLELMRRLNPDYVEQLRAESLPSGKLSDVLRFYRNIGQMQQTPHSTDEESESPRLKRCRVDVTSSTKPDSAGPSSISNRGTTSDNVINSHGTAAGGLVPNGAVTSPYNLVPTQPSNLRTTSGLQLEKYTLKRTLTLEKIQRELAVMGDVDAIKKEDRC